MNKIDFNNATPPTQEQFNQYHSEPIDYGEDGDQLLGVQYTKEEAIEKFRQDWIDKTGVDFDFDFEKSVIEANAGWAVNPDKYDGGQFTFVWLKGGTDTPAIYEAWLLWV